VAFGGRDAPSGRVTDEMDCFRLADKPSGGELINGFERYGDLSPSIGFVLRLHVRESIQ
jgi:hypothetical protein